MLLLECSLISVVCHEVLRHGGVKTGLSSINAVRCHHKFRLWTRSPLLRNPRTLALFSATCNRRSFAIRMESNPAGKRVPLPYGPAKRAPAFEELANSSFVFSNLQPSLLRNSYGKQSGREAGSSSVWPGQAGPCF